MTKEEREAHKAAYMASRQTPTFSGNKMTEKEAAKWARRNREVSETEETHYEMLQRSAKQNLPSSLKF